MKIPEFFLATLMVFSLCSCGQKPPPGPEAGAGASPATTAAEPSPVSPQVDSPSREARSPLPAVILLPSGWTMDRAILPSEVAAVMGKEGFAFFPEAASNAPAGKPVGSFNLSKVPYSQVRFEVRVQDGRAGYEKAVGFLKNPVEVPGNLWDVASLGEVYQGARTLVRLVGLRGPACFNITWQPSVYPGLDKTETSVRLAELLMVKLYIPR